MIQATVSSPGQLVQRAMDARDWSQSDLAFALGSTTATVNQILTGKRAISHNMARALSVALGVGAEELATAQALWDVGRADEPDRTIGARSRILARYPLRDMIKRGWINEDDTAQALEDQICRFFSVNTLDEVPHLAHAAKKTQYDEIPAPQLAWLFRVQQIAFEMALPSYDADKLVKAIEQFTAMRTDPALIRRVPHLLAQAGIRFVVVECLPGSKIDGVCFWLDDRQPVIGMSLRFDRIDNFWFVLRHECAHVLHGHGRQLPIIDSDVTTVDTSSISGEERLANSEAANFCVDARKMDSFYLRKKPFFPDREVMAFARLANTHPGLVVGQLQNRMKRYDLLRHHLVKMKEHLALAMMFDGWGDVVPTSS